MGGDICGCGGHVGVGDMWVSGTCGCGGHEGVGDLYSGGLVCLIPTTTTTTIGARRIADAGFSTETNSNKIDYKAPANG